MTPEATVASARVRRSLAEARPIDLFFDLTYPLAITRLTRQLVGDLPLRGASETLLLLAAVSEARNYTSWVTNYFDPVTRPVRLMLVEVPLASLIIVTADAPPACLSCAVHEGTLPRICLSGVVERSSQPSRAQDPARTPGASAARR